MGVMDQIQQNSMIEKLRETYAKRDRDVTGQNPAPPLPCPAPIATGLRIVAVAGPDWPQDAKDIAFGADATLNERQDAMDAFRWSDQIDKRASKSKATELIQGL